MFDALTARAIAAELNETIARGRVQAAILLDEVSVGFEIYAQHTRHYLLASADPNASRIHLVSTKLRAATLAPTPFYLLLRKYTNNAFVNHVSTLPRERIVQIEFDHAEFGISTLVAEVMGRQANLILLDAGGEVLDAVKRISPAKSRVRTVQPKEKYAPPPPQEKADPLSLTADHLARMLAPGELLWQTLVQNVAGTSPLLARELAFRVTGRVDATADPRIAEAMRARLAEIWNATAEPTLAYEGTEPSAVAAFALSHLPSTERFSSTSRALEKFFGAVESYESVKAPLRDQLQAARAKLERKRGSLQRELVSAEQIERLKTSGELILAYSSEIARGQKILNAEMIAGQPFEIKLDPKLRAVENAQRYFAEYRRAQAAAAQLPPRLEEVEADLAFADQVLADLGAAESRADIEGVVAEAREARLVRDSSTRKPAHTPALTAPRLFDSPDGFQVLVGRNARQNEQVTFERAAAEDLWLHARGAAGAHVVILTKGAPVPESTVEFAASLAAFYSQSRGEAHVDVIVVPRKNVRRVSGRAARPGLVTVRDERVVRVRPRNQDDAAGDTRGF